jgi:hypothetical protein
LRTTQKEWEELPLCFEIQSNQSLLKLISLCIKKETKKQNKNQQHKAKDQSTKQFLFLCVSNTWLSEIHNREKRLK